MEVQLKNKYYTYTWFGYSSQEMALLRLIETDLKDEQGQICDRFEDVSRKSWDKSLDYNSLIPPSEYLYGIRSKQLMQRNAWTQLYKPVTELELILYW